LLQHCLYEQTREQQRFYYLVSGSWLAWASGTVADHAAIHFSR